MRAFTLIEMVVAILLTALVFLYLYRSLDQVKFSHHSYERSVEKIARSEKVYNLFIEDFSKLRSPPHIVHEAGYDRIDFFTDHSLYHIPRPWVHYFISNNNRTLIRIESNVAINFHNSNYIADAKGTYFFADRLANGCQTLRFSFRNALIDFFLRCETLKPIAATLYTSKAKR